MAPLEGRVLRAVVRWATALIASPVLVGILKAIVVAWLGERSRINAPTIPNKKVIFLGPACGHMAYQMGFVGGLLEDDELKAAIVQSGAVFGGASSGAGVAAYAMAALNGAGSMEHWYNGIRGGYRAIKERGTWAIGAELEAGSRRYHAACLQALRARADAGAGGLGDAPGDSPDSAPIIPWLRHVPMLATAVKLIRPRFVTHFPTADALVKGVVASSYLPWLMGPVPHMGRFRPWVTLPAPWSGTPAFDGFVALYGVRWPDSYLLVTFLPTYPAWLLGGKHVLRASQYDSTGGGGVTGVLVSLFVKGWPWGDLGWNDAAFRRGAADAAENLPELRAQICAFLQG